MEIDPSAEWVIFSWRKYAASILLQCTNVRFSMSILYSWSFILLSSAIRMAMASAFVLMAPVRWFFSKVWASIGTSSRRVFLSVLGSGVLRISLAPSERGKRVIYFIQWVFISFPISNWDTLSACVVRGLGALWPATVKPSNSPSGSSPSLTKISSSTGWSSSSGFSSSPFSCAASCVSSFFGENPVKSSGTGASSSEESEPGIPVGCRRSVSSSSGSRGGRSSSSSICSERILVTGSRDFALAGGISARGHKRCKWVRKEK